MKNDVITANIADMDNEGRGIARVDGKVVFIPDTVTGDTVRAVIIKELKNSSVGKMTELLSVSPLRIQPDCPVCRQCGGCVFRHIKYGFELEHKKTLVQNALKRIGGSDTAVAEIYSGKSERYRNKVQYPFARDKDGSCIFGYYARHSHRVVKHESCLLQDDIFARIASFCADKANEHGIAAYDEESGEGILRHAVMRRSRKGEILLCLVAASEPEGRLIALCEEAYNTFDELIGVHININRSPGNAVFGEKTCRIIGEESLTDTLCGKKFVLSPRAFYQVNADMAERLYLKAKELAAVREGEVILDLYCGVGTIGLCIAEESNGLCGVEIIAPAAENARRNAKLNGRDEKNTLFVCGDASSGVEKCRERFGDPDVIIVDPPRKGLDEGVITTVCSASPDRVVYISCDPATLARDIKRFSEYGYFPGNAYAFDLFPRTGHVETVVLMSRV